MKLTRISGFTGKLNTMDLSCTEEQLAEGTENWERGMVIQEAFPFLSVDEREFIKTGCTPEEWNNIFK